MKSAHRIRALLLADILVRFAFFVMQNYLTDVWKLSFTHAAGILNIWNGISMILPFIFLFLVDAFIGNFTMLVISSIAYTLGIGLVAMSTPPGLAKLTGTCKLYEPQCISETQKVVFYAGMSLLAVGMSGYSVSLRPFLEEQKGNIPDDGDDDDESAGDEADCLNFFLVFLVPVIAAIALPYIKSWSLAFGIPAISSALATSIFLIGWSKYRKLEPQLEYHVKKWGLVPALQVEVTRFALRLLPLWITFIVCGIVTSIGNTYFIEQANHMDRKLGSWNVPIEVILLLCGWSKEGISLFVEKFWKCLDRGETFITLIATSVSYSVICCVIAAGVEIWRLKVITRHGLLDKPNEDIPMKVKCLYPQFFLLTIMDFGIEMAVASISKEFLELSIRKYLVYFCKGVSGVGFMCGVLSVYVVGEVSERGGNNRSWFQFTLNQSRLDRYYWVLAVLSGVNLVLFIAVVRCYGYMYEKEVVEDTGASADLSSQRG